MKAKKKSTWQGEAASGHRKTKQKNQCGHKKYMSGR